MKRVPRLETSVCFRITSLMNSQMKSRKRATSHKKKKKRQECCGFCENLYHNWVVCHKIQMHSFLEEESCGETRCRKSWVRFEEYGSLRLRYVMRVSGRRKDHRWENVKVLHQQSAYALKFEDMSHEETERQQRCDRCKAWNLAKNKYMLTEKDTATFRLPIRGICRLSG